MRRSPLHDLNAELGARFVDFGGWEMPVQYESVLTEHRAVRSRAGVFDVSHLGRFRLTGPGSGGALDRLLSNSLEKIEPGRTQYTLMLNERGGVIDDLIVWWWDNDDYWVLPNATNHERVMAAFAREPGCEVTDLRTTTAQLALQGPEAPALFETVVGSAPKRFHTGLGSYEEKPVPVAGTGYTGERGGELCPGAAHGPELFRALIDAGAVPCGLGARDTLRLEAGLALWGEDIDESTTPFEAGLDFAVSFDHDFTGKEVIAGQAEDGVGCRLVGFVLEERGIPRHGYPLRTPEGEGQVTSGNMSPILGKGIGLGYVSPPVDSGPIEVEIRGKWVPGSIVSPPFHKTS